ncbi:MAG: flavin reductase family protein, partial [Bacteroidota bacterium]
MIEPSTLSPRELYRLFINCVVPRPIALVTSVSSEGVVNAAPFSFFNAVSASPPVLMISVGRRKGALKDTATNIL